MRKTVGVFGCGLVGQLIAKELSRDYLVNVYDHSQVALDKMMDTPFCHGYLADLSDTDEVRRTVLANDLIVCAVPGSMGYKIITICAEQGKKAADISFSPTDPLQLNDLAKTTGARIVVDCGVAPGMSNLFAGHIYNKIDELDKITIMVGGLPLKRTWPFEYNLVFSLTDVLEEYTRPSRFIENYRVITRPALSDREFVDLPKCDTLEAFNTDGLRTLLTTLNVPNMIEKTLRFPGHIDKMMVFREAGFFDDVDIEVDGREMNPRKLTEKLFTKCWILPKDEGEFTVLRVEGIRHSADGRPHWVTWDLYDQTRGGQTSMARTTGLPCATMLRLLDKSDWIEPGVWPLELLADNQKIVDCLVGELELHEIQITCSDNQNHTI